MDDGTTVAGTIKQSIYIGYEIIEDLDSDNIMGMYLTLDLPSDLVPEGTVIVQSVRYRKEFAYADDWQQVSCKTVVGDEAATEVINYKSQAKLEGTEGVTYDESDADWKIDESMVEDGETFYRVREDDADAYKLEDFGEYTGNKVQNCIVQLPFPKFDFDQDWFGVYDIEFDARIYASATATTWTQVEKTESKQDFQPPIYHDEELVEEIEELNSIHEIVFISETFPFQMSDVDSTWTGEGEQEIVGTLKVNPDPWADQVVEIWMKTTIPAEYGVNMEGMTVMNYISFQDFYDDEELPTKLVCTTMIGDKWNHSVHQYDH